MSRAPRNDSAQTRALQRYRSRLRQRGMARFEVLGLDRDRQLIRSLAKRLAEDGAEAARIRSEVRRTVEPEPVRAGGIVAALRRSPLVEAVLNVQRPREGGRKADV